MLFELILCNFLQKRQSQCSVINSNILMVIQITRFSTAKKKTKVKATSLFIFWYWRNVSLVYCPSVAHMIVILVTADLTLS